MRIRSEKHLSNITKRGKVNTDKDDQDGYTVGPLVLGFFLFVILGSGTLIDTYI